MKSPFLAALLLSAVCQCAFAATGKAPIQATSQNDFAKVVASVRAEMAPKGRYAEVAGVERSRVNARLDEMTALFAKDGDVSQMGQADKVALFNAQEEVNGILLKRDGDRLVCKTEARSGTHFKNTTCKTAREIAIDQENAQKWYANSLPRNGVQCAPGLLPGQPRVGAQSCVTGGAGSR